jgi:hypothetical protein
VWGFVYVQSYNVKCFVEIESSPTASPSTKPALKEEFELVPDLEGRLRGQSTRKKVSDNVWIWLNVQESTLRG